MKSGFKPYDASASAKRMRSLWLTLAVVAVFAAIAFASKQSETNSPLTPQSASQIQTVALPEVKTIVSRQDAEGVTEADFSPEFLKNLEAWTHQRTIANAEKHWDALNVPESARIVSVEGVYVEAGGKKFAVLRTRTNNIAPSAVVVGVLGSDLVRIGCVVEAEQDVQISSGPCNEKVKEVFGVSLSPLSSPNG